MAWSEFRAVEVLATALDHLRTRINITNYVQFDTNDEAKAVTDTVSIPIAGGITDAAASGTAAPFAAPASNDSDAKVTLTEWRRADFVINDKDASTSRVRDIIRTKTGAAADALASRLAGYLFDLASQSPNVMVKSDAVDLDTLAEARVNLNKRNCPVGNRAALMGPTMELDLLKDDDFQQADKAGQTLTRMSGVIGMAMGFDVVGNNNSVNDHTPGLRTAHAFNGAVAAGAKTANIDSHASQPKVGDLFRTVNSGPLYRITKVQVNGGSDFTIEFTPGLAANVADNATVHEVIGAGEQSLTLHNSAIVLAMRPLDMPNAESAFTTTMMDPETGIPLRLEVVRQNKQTLYTLDWLYGATLVRPECTEVIYRTT